LIDVALIPGRARPSEVAVVIDVLRATSTATQALAAGYERVLCVDSIEGALRLRAPGRVLAGERNCLMPPGFDQGNSPSEASSRAGVELVLATTNGAPAIVSAARRSAVTLLACVLNLRAVLGVLRDTAGDIQIVCSGSEGEEALEDVYLAGRICAALPGPRSESALVAEGLTGAYPTALAALSASPHASALEAAGLGADIADCARESVIDVVPVASELDGVAVVTPYGAG
jgi:2-phosphosulfolactate phosphatase